MSATPQCGIKIVSLRPVRCPCKDIKVSLSEATCSRSASASAKRMVALEPISQLPKYPWNLTDDVILGRSRVLGPSFLSHSVLRHVLLPHAEAEPRGWGAQRKGWSRRAKSDPPEGEFSRGSRKSLNLDCTSEMTLVPTENFVPLARHCLKAPKKRADRGRGWCARWQGGEGVRGRVKERCIDEGKRTGCGSYGDKIRSTSRRLAFLLEETRSPLAAGACVQNLGTRTLMGEVIAN